MIAQTGIARAIYPVHAPLDGDVVFAAATGDKPVDPLVGLTELGMVAANVVARAIARGVYTRDRPALCRRAAGVEGPVRLGARRAQALIACDDDADAADDPATGAGSSARSDCRTNVAAADAVAERRDVIVTFEAIGIGQRGRGRAVRVGRRGRGCARSACASGSPDVRSAAGRPLGIARACGVMMPP